MTSDASLPMDAALAGAIRSAGQDVSLRLPTRAQLLAAMDASEPAPADAQADASVDAAQAQGVAEPAWADGAMPSVSAGPADDLLRTRLAGTSPANIIIYGDVHMPGIQHVQAPLDTTQPPLVRGGQAGDTEP